LLQEAVAQLAQLTLLSRTTAVAILETALKQMHFCALLHSDVNHLSFTSVLFFAGHTSLSCLLPSCSSLLATCCLRAGGAGCWLVPAL
jgi:hypothetical protein